jgi:hypothetical protein
MSNPAAAKTLTANCPAATSEPAKARRRCTNSASKASGALSWSSFQTAKTASASGMEAPL